MRRIDGEWHIDDTRGNGDGIFGNRLVIASGIHGSTDIVLCTVNQQIPEADEIAQRIAAAPDMLAALERIERFVSPTGECEDAWSGDCISIRAIVRQAIAKATASAEGEK